MLKRFCFSGRYDKITSVGLNYLCAQVIRGGFEGLEHLEALMRLRELDLGVVDVAPHAGYCVEARVVQALGRQALDRHGAIRRAILAALRKGARGPIPSG